MRIVLDTNVLLAGMFTRGLCEALLEVCLGGEQHEVIGSKHILSEFAEHAQAKFHVPAERVARAATALRERMTVVTPARIPTDACRDPNDLAVLGTLVAARADCLVTGDKDLLVLKRFDGRPILTPRQCYELVAS